MTQFLTTANRKMAKLSFFHCWFLVILSCCWYVWCHSLPKWLWYAYALGANFEGKQDEKDWASSFTLSDEGLIKLLSSSIVETHLHKKKIIIQLLICDSVAFPPYITLWCFCILICNTCHISKTELCWILWTTRKTKWTAWFSGFSFLCEFPENVCKLFSSAC